MLKHLIHISASIVALIIFQAHFLSRAFRFIKIMNLFIKSVYIKKCNNNNQNPLKALWLSVFGEMDLNYDINNHWNFKFLMHIIINSISHTIVVGRTQFFKLYYNYTPFSLQSDFFFQSDACQSMNMQNLFVPNLYIIIIFIFTTTDSLLPFQSSILKSSFRFNV